MDFPTLNIGMDSSSYTCKPAMNTVSQAKSEAGYIQLRRTVTSVPMQHHIEYKNITKTEKQTLMDFWLGAIGFPFNWVSPSGDTISVKFISDPEFSGTDSPLYHNVKFDLLEQ